MATIELYFKPIAFNGTGLKHEFLIYRDDAGRVTGFSRGGPESYEGSTSSGTAFGKIVTSHGDYNNDNTNDYNTNVYNGSLKGYIVYSGSSTQVEAIKQSDYSRLDQIRNLGISYDPLSQNSNSVVGTLLMQNGFNVPNPVFADNLNNAPAYNINLFKLSNPDFIEGWIKCADGALREASYSYLVKITDPNDLHLFPKANAAKSAELNAKSPY